MNDISAIERTVMRRVRVMRALRIAFSNGSIATVVCLLALWGIGREVWVAQVFQNAPKDLSAAIRFFIYAFDHTRFAVQFLSFVTVAALVTLAHETAHAVTSALTPARA